MVTIAFTGNVARPELNQGKGSGKSYLDFNAAYTPREKDQSGNWGDGQTIWFSVRFFGNRLFSPEALHAAIDGTKATVLVTGKLEKARVYTGKSGDPQVSLDVTANEVGILQKDGGGHQRPSSGGFGGQSSARFGAPQNGAGGFGQIQPAAWENDTEVAPF